MSYNPNTDTAMLLRRNKEQPPHPTGCGGAFFILILP